MRRFGLFVAVGLALVGPVRAQDAGELPPEIAARYARKSELPAGLPTGPSIYRNWRSPRSAPWRFGYVGSTRYETWSDAALKVARQKIEPEWEQRGLSKELITPPASKDDAEASHQIRALADQGVDAILVCCGTPNGLNEAIKYAHEKGALIVTLFGFSTSPYALNTAIDFFHVGNYLTQGIAGELNEEGNVLIVGGFLTSPVSEAVDRGVKAAFKDFPKVKSVGDLPVRGDLIAARAAVKSWLASHRESVDGVIVRAGASDGILKTFAEAGRKLPLITIGGDLGSICYWRHNPNFAGDDFLRKAIVGWPPGDSIGLAYDVAQRTLQGQGPLTQSILVDPAWLSFYEMTSSVPATCHEDDDGWYYLGGDSWPGMHALDHFFGKKPVDPRTYKP